MMFPFYGGVDPRFQLLGRFQLNEGGEVWGGGLKGYQLFEGFDEEEGYFFLGGVGFRHRSSLWLAQNCK